MWQSTSSKVGTIFRLSVCDSVHFDKIRSTVLTHIHRMSSGSCFFSGVLSLDSSLRRLRLFTSRDVTVSFLKSSSDLVIVDLFASLISNSMWMSAFRVLSFDSPERQLFNDYSHLGMWQSTLLPSKWEQSFRLSVWDSLHFDKNRSTILTHIHRLSSGSWFFWVLSLDSSHSRLRLFTSRDVTVCSSDLVIVNLPASMIINFVWMSVFRVLSFDSSGVAFTITCMILGMWQSVYFLQSGNNALIVSLELALTRFDPPSSLVSIKFFGATVHYDYSHLGMWLSTSYKVGQSDDGQPEFLLGSFFPLRRWMDIRALHRVPIPMPMAFGWAWVRYYW